MSEELNLKSLKYSKMNFYFFIFNPKDNNKPQLILGYK